MANGKKRELLRFETDGHGVYKWEVLTQKPFAEFKEAVNEGHDSSWLRPVVNRTWEDKTVRFKAWTGAEGHARWGDGRVLVELHVLRIPAKWFEKEIVFDVRQLLNIAAAWPRTAEIEEENKESLRQSVLETYREACLNEVEAGILISRWQAMDEVTKVLAALTASGSAVAGWLVWGDNDPWKKAIWQFMAGTASVLSITHVALKVSDRVKDWSDTKGHFVRLRIDLETLLYRMKVNQGYELAELAPVFEALRVRYGEGIDRKKVDPLAIGARARAAVWAQERFEAMRLRTDRESVA